MTKLTKPKTIVCFGDSNTHGYNSSNDGRLTEQERWTCLLDTYLGDEYRIIEEGLGGRTTVFDDPIFEGLSGLAYLFPCLMSHEPVDLLIIMLGTNDTKERFRATPANIAKGLERLTQKAIDTTAAWRDKPNILLIAPAPIEPGYENTLVAGEMAADVSKNPVHWPLCIQTRQSVWDVTSWMPVPLKVSICIHMITCT